MSAERNLIEYLPPFIAQYGEIAAALNAENPEFNEINAKIGEILDNEFIGTADEYGLSRFEEMLGIKPYDSDTLEDRRFRVLSKFNETAPYTLRSLDDMLKNICGENGYILELIADEYTIKVRIALKVKKQSGLVGEALERMLPCNMLYSVELLFNTWRFVKNYAWGALKSYSWRHIKEEVLS